MGFCPPLPPTIWLRLVWLFYRIMWVFRPLLRRFGIETKMSWKEVIFATKLLLPAIKSYGPDVIVGVGVGGGIWSALLAGSLHDLPFLVIDRQVRYDGNERKVNLIGVAGVEANADLIREKKVLLVNAEVISGETIKLAKNLLNSLNPDQIRLGCLDFNTVSKVRPDFAYVSHSGVIQKPWRAVPTYTNPDEPVRQ